MLSIINVVIALRLHIASFFFETEFKRRKFDININFIGVQVENAVYCDLGGHHFCECPRPRFFHIIIFIRTIVQRIEQIALICVTPLRIGIFIIPSSHQLFYSRLFHLIFQALNLGV